MEVVNCSPGECGATWKLLVDGKPVSHLISKHQGRLVIEKHVLCSGVSAEDKAAALMQLEATSLPEKYGGSPLEELLGLTFGGANNYAKTREEKIQKMFKMASRKPELVMLTNGDHSVGFFAIEDDRTYLLHETRTAVGALAMALADKLVEYEDFDRIYQAIKRMALPEICDLPKEPQKSRYDVFEGEIYGEHLMLGVISDKHGRMYADLSRRAATQKLEALCHEELVSLDDYAGLKVQINDSKLPGVEMLRIVTHDLGDGWTGKATYCGGLRCSVEIIEPGTATKN